MPKFCNGAKLTNQTISAACVAGYIGAFAGLGMNLIWRIQTGADARICPVGSQDWNDLCTLAEISGAFLLNFIWALFALPFALIVTVPCAMLLGLVAPQLERRLDTLPLAIAQYPLGAFTGLIAGYLLGVSFPGLIGALAGVWVFRLQRYQSEVNG